MLPVYDIFIDDKDDELGVDFNSLVSYPAHSKSMLAFGKGVKYAFNEDKRMVTGVMIAVNHLIYRNAQKDMPARYVRFTSKTVEQIRNKFHANGFNNNVNLEHNPNDKVKGVVMVESYIVSESDPKKPQVPEALSKQNIQDGSWIATYHITDDSVWDKVKSGEFGGFSVEGYFMEKMANLKIDTKMSKNNKSLFSYLFGGENEQDPQPADNVEFAKVMTIEGVELTYEGDLAVGTALQVTIDGQQLPAPEGEHVLDVDGVNFVIQVDAEGVITEMTEVEATPEVTAEEMKAAFEHITKAIDTKLSEMKAEIMEAVKSEISGSKFQQEARKSGNEPQVKNWKTLIK